MQCGHGREAPGRLPVLHSEAKVGMCRSRYFARLSRLRAEAGRIWPNPVEVGSMRGELGPLSTTGLIWFLAKSEAAPTESGQLLPGMGQIWAISTRFSGLHFLTRPPPFRGCECGA